MGVVSQMHGKNRIFFPIDKRVVVWYTKDEQKKKVNLFERM